MDSDTLPLSVSRETLQAHSSLKVIKKKIVRKVLDALKRLSDAERDAAKSAPPHMHPPDLIIYLQPRIDVACYFLHVSGQGASHIKLAFIDYMFRFAHTKAGHSRHQALVSDVRHAASENAATSESGRACDGA